MKDLIAANGGPAATILLVLVSTNIILTAVKSMIEKWEPTPEQQANNKVLAVISKILGVTGKVIDWLTANKAH